MRWHRNLLAALVVFAGLLARVDSTRAEEAAAGVPAARESLPEGSKLVGLDVHPSSIELENRFAYRQVLVTGRLDGGDLVDVTRMARIAPTDLVSVSPTGLVRPMKDGEGELRVEVGALTTSIPVRVTGQTAPYAASFVQDVMPVMSRIGCNAGTCHGAAQGRNGFKLSLRGYDPLFDHRALTDDLAGRRFNRAAPDRSLFLLKTSGQRPHVGGVVTRPGEPYYEIFRSWVADGATADFDSARVQSIEVFPKSPVLPLPGMRQQMAVLATYTDGRVRDVTAEAFVETSDTEITRVEGTIVTGLRRGEAAILLRYEGRYAAAPLIVMGDRGGFEWKDVPTYNYIDELVYRKLRNVRTLASDVCSDAEFIRRIYLDLTGLPPKPKEVRTFLMDGRDSRKKREELVDRLIGGAEFVDFWTNKWSDLLQVNRKFLGPQGAESLHDWVRGAIASNLPYDKFVYTVLTASGSTLENPPAAYYKVHREPEEVMENTTQLFLGVRFNCNKCHDHPFERWTQDNYWSLSAYFARVGRKDAPGSPKMPQETATQTNNPAFEEIIFDKEEGEVQSPNGTIVTAAFPYRHAVEMPEEPSRRAELARWVTAPSNPYFAKSFVNRLWSYFFGVGFINPVDDIRAGNPPSNPELLERLTREFIDSGFDSRRLMRLILTSRVYQHSIVTNRWNEDDQINFAHALARRLPAEVLFDAIHQATGSTTKLPGARLGTRVAALADSNVSLDDGFLDLFGKPPRESSCECERTSGMSLGQSLNLVNGPTVGEAIRDPRNSIADFLAVEKNAKKVVEELFISFLCRTPAESEEKEMVAALDPGAIDNFSALSPQAAEQTAAEQVEWEKSQNIATWSVLHPEYLKSAGGATLAKQDDGTIVVSGESPEKDIYTLIATTDQKGITGVRIEALPDDALPKKGPGRADTGNFALTELGIAAVPVADAKAARGVILENATATFSQNEYGVGAAIDGKIDDKGWAIHPRVGERQQAVFEFKEDIGADGGTLLTLTLHQQFGTKHTLGKFRVWVTTSSRPVRTLSMPEDLAAIVLTSKDKRTPEQEAALFRYFVSKNPAVADRIRLHAAQDIAWALVNTPAFLFNR